MSNLFAQVADVVSPPDKSPEWFVKIVEKFKLQKFFNYIGITVTEALVVFYFFMAAFFIGFAFKRYFKFIISCATIIAALAIVLESKNILTIDWVALKSFVGLEHSAGDLESLWSVASSMISSNIHNSVGALVGLIIGYRLG